MKKKYGAITLVALILLILGFSKVTTEACLGARPLSMGGAFVAVADDIHSCYWNPAGMGNLQGSELTYMQTLNNKAVINYQNWAAGGIKIGSGGIGISHVKAINDYFDIYDAGTGTYRYTYYTNDDWMTFSIGGWGTGIFENTAMGINIRRYSHALEKRDDFKLWESGKTTREGLGYEAGVNGYDIGILHKMSDKINLGLLIQDVNEPRYNFNKDVFVCNMGHAFEISPGSECPVCLKENNQYVKVEPYHLYRRHARNFRPGIAWRPDEDTVIAMDIYYFNVKDAYDDEMQSEVRIGVEKWLTDKLSVRAGFYGKSMHAIGLGLRSKPAEGSTAPNMLYHIDYGLLESGGSGTHLLSATVKF
jgi:hypothetical protein